MGYYINPPDMTKEEWLSQFGKPIQTPNDYDFSGPNLPVCLVDNGWMTAAGIVPHKRELEAFTDKNDLRPKKWFDVAKADLKPYYSAED